MSVREPPKPPVSVPQGGAFATTVSPKHRHPWLSRPVAAAAAILILALGAVTGWWLAHRPHAIVYTTVPASRRTLVQTVTATGTVNPQDTINVGTQVSGTISELDADYNSHVRAGQVLARIDPVSFEAEAAQARGALGQSQAQLQAALAAARAAESTARGAGAGAVAARASAEAATQSARADAAAVATAEANVTKTRSSVDLARLTYERDATLYKQGFVPQNHIDSDRDALVAATMAYNGALATVRQVRAQAAAGGGTAAASSAQSEAQRLAAVTASQQHAGSLAQADAQRSAVVSAAATLQAAQINLARTVITSPVDGTVIARNVSIGQTVAASFQTPTLFSIAQNLRNMQVDVAVGEPDIGGVAAGQTVDFTVLAFPHRVFHGRVWMVRQNPTTVANVVTYDTVVYVDNRDGALRPGMTANASIHVAKVNNAIVVPLEALTYTPSERRPQSVAPAKTGGSIWGNTLAAGSTSVVSGRPGRIHVLVDGRPHRVRVNVLLVAGTDAAVAPIGQALNGNERVVIGDDANPAPRATVNPQQLFGPQPRTGPR